jgi:hypothetical protein
MVVTPGGLAVKLQTPGSALTLAFFDDLCSATSRPRTSICARRRGKGTDPLQVAASNSEKDACSCESPIDRGGVHKPLEISAGQG